MVCHPILEALMKSLIRCSLLAMFVSLVLVRPAGAIAAPASQQGAEGTVLILPFDTAGAPAELAWMGRAIQQDLVADLLRGDRSIRVLAPTHPAAPDAEAARHAAQEAGAA